MSDPVLVFASFTPMEDKTDDLRGVLETMVKHTREEPGNEVYDLYAGKGEEPAFHLFERYTDGDALDAHRASDHYKAYRAALPDLLSTPVEVTVLSEVDAVGA